METWMWITLYIVQTIAGAVIFRKYSNKSSEESLAMSATVIINCVGLVLLLVCAIECLYKQLLLLIDFLAGVNKKDTLKEMQKSFENYIKCTGNNEEK